MFHESQEKRTAMKLTQDELEYLAAWAREEWEPACYHLPAHKLQLAHGVAGHSFIALIKAWTKAERRKDNDILEVSASPTLSWPWSSSEELQVRLREASTTPVKSTSI